MEDKNIIINDTKYNFFKFYNINQPLTELKYFNIERLNFTKPVMRKLPNNSTLSFHRIFLAISAPKPRNIFKSKEGFQIKNVFDVNEFLDYDSQTDTSEFTTKYDFSKLEDSDYYILIDYEWYKNNIDSGLQDEAFVYNLMEEIYADEPEQKEIVLSKFKVFNATELYKKKPTLLNKIPSEHYHTLITQKWVKKNLSEKYQKAMAEEYKPLVFSSEEVFSFGVARNTLDTSNVSYQISLCLYDRENPKPDEIKWAAKYEELATACREYLKKSEFKKSRGAIDDIKGLSWKKKLVGDADGPKLYPKIMFNQTKEEFITVFMDETDEMVEDPKLILDKKCKVKAALRFESIFIGSKMALQVRVNDILVSKWIEAYKPKALICRKNPNNFIASSGSSKKSSKEDSDEEFSDSSSEEEEEEVQKPVKRVVKTVKMSD